ncbi:MAG: hypothetical protein WCS73_12810, partial [Lentisphaeria bacterium]
AFLEARPNGNNAPSIFPERDCQPLDVVGKKNWSPQLYTPVNYNTITLELQVSKCYIIYRNVTFIDLRSPYYDIFYKN